VLPSSTPASPNAEQRVGAADAEDAASAKQAQDAEIATHTCDTARRPQAQRRDPLASLLLRRALLRLSRWVMMEGRSSVSLAILQVEHVLIRILLVRAHEWRRWGIRTPNPLPGAAFEFAKSCLSVSTVVREHRYFQGLLSCQVYHCTLMSAWVGVSVGVKLAYGYHAQGDRIAASLSWRHRR
jgi:hypothetical protein